jgi:hypothetical protein
MDAAALDHWLQESIERAPTFSGALFGKLVSYGVIVQACPRRRFARVRRATPGVRCR